MTPGQTSTLRPPGESVQAASAVGRGGEATTTLESRYDGDAGLLTLYKKKLPKRGWAGSLDAVERAYVREARRRAQW